MAIAARIYGLDGIRAALLGVAPRLRKRVLRTALRAGAVVIRNEARRLAPVLKTTTYGGASALRRGVRAVGTLRRAISVRTSKASTRRGDVGVFINVRPLRDGASAKNPKDPYYWRWMEFGWTPASPAISVARKTKSQRRRLNKIFASFIRAGGTKKPGQEFLRGAAKKVPEALEIIKRSIGPAIVRLNVKGGGPL